MPSWIVLLPELWLAIFDHIIEARVNPADSCNHLNYPEISRHLREPGRYGPIEDSYCQLRLVCRAFKALVGPSPYIFMRYDNTGIPATARAVYIIPFQDSPNCLRRIFGEPRKVLRLTTLHIGYDASVNLEGRISFAFLFENAHLLSGLRVLGINVCDPREKTLGFNFWVHLNAAFPHLTCLTLQLIMEWRSSLFVLATEDDDQSMTFNQLEILDLSGVLLYPGLRLPSLRHIAFDRCSQNEIETLALSPLLESIILRGLERNMHLDLSILHNLRSLGVPNDGKDVIQPLPHDYPLTHLCAFLLPPMIDYSNILSWVRKTSSYFPGISRLTVDLTLLKATDRLWIEALFTHRSFLSNGFLVTPFRAGTPQIVIEPILGPFQQDTSSVDSSQIVPTTRTGRIKAVWDRFSRYASFHPSL